MRAPGWLILLDKPLEGMKPIELLAAIGAPDFVNFGHEAWEYDMDASPPYTLRVHWRDKKVVDRVERIEPPLWQQGETRYADW